MSKKTAKLAAVIEQPQTETPPEIPQTPKPPDLSAPHIQTAIAAGKAEIDAGKTKADAARAMYALLSKEEKDVIVAAFVAGATLTDKGALTYWYNCKRKASKASK